MRASSGLFFRIKPAGERRYLQIVENSRDGARTVQSQGHRATRRGTRLRLFARTRSVRTFGHREPRRCRRSAGVGIAASVRQGLQQDVPHTRQTAPPELPARPSSSCQTHPADRHGAPVRLIQITPSNTRRWLLVGRPPCGEGRVRNGSIIAHSWFVIRPRITANLQYRGQRRITPALTHRLDVAASQASG
jgi:hypothetical protein